jgi:DNA-binding response OmpR family regulator
MRILIVEDEPDLLAGLAQALREEGYAVDTADNGEDGLFNAEGTDYDAIVLDVMLPGMDGFEVLKNIRKKSEVPVLMLTARGEEASAIIMPLSGSSSRRLQPQRENSWGVVKSSSTREEVLGNWGSRANSV